ncbi:hypothetical protein SDRG_05831, partial [Saprolegnia diclina VS20]
MKLADATLGLETSASPDDVRQAYKKLALKFHPDKNQGEDTTAKFQAISAAYKRISDPKSNQDELHGDGGFGMDINVEEMFHMFDMMFGSMGRGKKGGRRRRQPEFNFEDMFFGGIDPSELDDEELEFMASMGMDGSMFDGMGDDFDDLGDLASFMQSMAFMDMKMPHARGSKKRGLRVGMPPRRKGAVRVARATSKVPSAPAAAPTMPPPAPAPCKPSSYPTLTLDERVLVFGKLQGRVAYVGPVHYAKGDLVGVVLDEPLGKNDGTLKGHTYFTCAPSHGLMVHPIDVVPLS